MINENQLEDTSDSIMPVKNGLGIPSEVFNEIIREFKRACLSKEIDKAALNHYMEHKSSWQIKCVAIGSVSNIVINMGVDCEPSLGLLQNLGEDIVTDEIVRITLDESGTNNSAPKNLAKKSTHKILNTKSNSMERKKESQGNLAKPLVYRNTKTGGNVWILASLAILSVILAVVLFMVFDRSSEIPKANSSLPDSNQVAIVPEPKNAPDAPPPPVKEVPKPIKPIEQKIDFPEVLPYAGKMIIPEGILIYQSGYDNFIGGEIVTLYSNKRKSSISPFMVGNYKGTAYTLIRFDLRNIPADAIIENAILNINLTTLNENNEAFNLYCLPVNKEWSLGSIAYLKESSSSEISLDGLIKRATSTDKVSINMKNEWVSFNATKIVKEWVSKKSTNNGFALFSESQSEVIFEGFESNKKMLSPKLMITFGKEIVLKDKPKEEENKTVDPKPIEKEVATTEPKENSNKPNHSKENANLKDPVNSEKKKEEEVEEVDPLISIFDKKLDKDKPEEKAEEKTEKTPTKNIFDEDATSTAEKEKEKTKEKTEVVSGKTKGNSGSTPRNNEKTEGVKPEETVDLTMKMPEIFPLERLIEAHDTIKLENKENKGEIRFTLDGKEPTPDSPIYVEPIKLIGNQLQVLKSAIYLDRVRKSPVSTHEYRVLNGLSRIIDNNNSACKKTGEWESSKSKPNYYGKDYIWEQKGKGTVEWIPSIAKKSICEVYIWIPDGDAVTRSSKARYVVKYEGGSKEVLVDQTKRGTKWIYLGTYPMKSGAGSLTLFDDESGKMFVADAACFHFLSDAPNSGN